MKLLIYLSILFLLFVQGSAFAQIDSLDKPTATKERADSIASDSVSAHYDVADLFKQVFFPNRPAKTDKKFRGITPMPNFAYNPSIGAQIGIKAVAGRVLGKDPKTYMSVAATSASITTKGIIYAYLSHNIFTPGNKWNLAGSIVAAKTVTPDFGIGIGESNSGSEEDQVLTNQERKGYILHAQYFSFREKVYKQIDDHLFVGAGVSFDIRRKIEDRNNAGVATPYSIYSERHGFDQSKYQANGLLFNIQYTSRDNQNRAYKGIYADAGVRMNQTWMGSSKSSLQLTTDFRKYWSLSEENPEHVLAFWHWGSYLISGDLPFLELPGTGKDGSARSGRGYTVGFFKGPRYFYSEVEYRFPITRNKFISGVTFFHVQTTDNELGTKLMEHWQPGGGAGLRILFNKHTRTNLCVDYAFGKFGARGLFLGLNESF